MNEVSYYCPVFMELMDSTVAGKCQTQLQKGKQPQIRDCKCKRDNRKKNTQTREKTNTKAKEKTQHNNQNRINTFLLCCVFSLASLIFLHLSSLICSCVLSLPLSCLVFLFWSSISNFSLAALLKGTNKVIYLSICLSIYLSIYLPIFCRVFLFLFFTFHFSVVFCTYQPL